MTANTGKDRPLSFCRRSGGSGGVCVFQRLACASEDPVPLAHVQHRWVLQQSHSPTCKGRLRWGVAHVSRATTASLPSGTFIRGRRTWTCARPLPGVPVPSCGQRPLSWIQFSPTTRREPASLPEMWEALREGVPGAWGPLASTMLFSGTGSLRPQAWAPPAQCSLPSFLLSPPCAG